MANKYETPQFKESLVQDNRIDGYWVQTFWADPNDKYPSLIGYGLTIGDVSVFDNPYNKNPDDHDAYSKPWKQYVVARFDSPVGATIADVKGTGATDIIVSHDYGPNFWHCNPTGGNISWLENPGRTSKGDLQEYWVARNIGRWPAMHRLSAGYFTQKEVIEVAAMSVVYGPVDDDTPELDLAQPIPVIVFRRPPRATGPTLWTQVTVDEKNFTVIHESVAYSFAAQEGRQSLFVASREGINSLAYDTKTKLWNKTLIHKGLEKQEGAKYWGSACVAVGKIPGNEQGYVTGVDPFHGTQVTVMTRIGGKGEWHRRVLDDYGTATQLRHQGDGPGHHVVTGDFDNDGIDEFLVALFGPPPFEAIYYYKPMDLDNGIWAKWKVSTRSSGRIAMGDFNKSGKISFGSIIYKVPFYHEADTPRLYLYTHDFPLSTVKRKLKTGVKVGTQIIGTIWGGEPLYYLPRPTEITSHVTAKILKVAGYNVTVEVHAANIAITNVPAGTTIKIIWGELLDGSTVRKPLNVPDFTELTATTTSGTLHSKAKGVIFVRFDSTLEDAQRNWTKTADVPVSTDFVSSYEGLTLPAPLKFVKVEDLWFGKPFKGVEFYNMSGAFFRFFDQTEICHTQWWTAAKGVNCGVHNHAEDNFLEVHLCLSQGTKSGGMWRVKDGTTIPEDPNTLPPDSFDKLPLPSRHEHGPLFKRDANGNPARVPSNNAVDYPYHKWQGGADTGLDIWTAFEFNPKLYPELK